MAYFMSEETCTIKIWHSLMGYGHFLVWSKDVINSGSVIRILKSKRWLGQTAKHRYNYECIISINHLQDYDLCVQVLLESLLFVFVAQKSTVILKLTQCLEGCVLCLKQKY